MRDGQRARLSFSHRHNGIHIDAPVNAVFNVLEDPRLYAVWVLRASAVRGQRLLVDTGSDLPRDPGRFPARHARFLLTRHAPVPTQVQQPQDEQPFDSLEAAVVDMAFALDPRFEP
jgi:hypothetical protein